MEAESRLRASSQWVQQLFPQPPLGPLRSGKRKRKSQDGSTQTEYLPVVINHCCGGNALLFSAYSQLFKRV